MDAAWKTLEMALQMDIAHAELQQALQALIDADAVNAVELKLISTLETSIQRNILSLLHADSQYTFAIFVHNVYDHVQLHEQSFQRILEILSRLTNCHILSSLQRVYLTTLQYPEYRRISKLAKDFYLSTYTACTALVESEDQPGIKGDQGCNNCNSDVCQCEQIRAEMSAIDGKVKKLGFFHSIIEETLLVIVQTKIEERVAMSSGVFDRNVIEGLVQWLNEEVSGWLRKATYRYDSSEILASEHLLFHLYESFVKLRLGEMLPMIIDYPDSKASFEDLHFALPHTDLRPQLITSLKQVYENRILHPGVTTTDILTAYIQSIQALRVLDSSCVLLEIVTEPVKQYLRSRDDTVRCIVSNLIDDTCEILSDELTKAVSDQDIVDEDNMGDEWQSWQPDPADANPETSSKTRRSTDIINMLVNIYGSKELFIKEYWNLLADRLLSNLSYTTLWEIRYFELLKIRFGESDLHKCEVMLKDMTDSKRLNTWINDELVKAPDDQQIPFQINAMMLSGQYWPSFRDEKLQLPQQMQSVLEKYTKAYEITKVNRTLKWQPHIGQIEVDVEMDSGQILSLKTTPVNVAILMAFEEKEVYTVEELSEKLETGTSVIRKKIPYWVTHGVLREQSHDVYSLNKDRTTGAMGDMVEEDAESAMASAEEQREEEFQMLWTYVNGMLTNMESQSLERIHAMLKMFANTECSIVELEDFLSRKIREGKLVCAAGVYKLVK